MQPTTTNLNEPQRTITNPKEPQRATTSHNEPRRATMNHNEAHRLTTATRKLSSITLWTLCFICNKIIISYFYGVLFSIFYALLFSFVKFKLQTYHNSCLPSDSTKTKSAAFNFNLLIFFHKQVDHSLLFSTYREPVFVF